MSTFDDIFAGRPAVIGVVHLQPLPGAPRYGGRMEPILDAALADAEALVTAGVDGIIVENFGDTPFHADRVPPETIAAMTRAVGSVVHRSGLPVGVNVLRNDARAALGVAAATGARFIRVNVHVGAAWTDQGLIRGRAVDTLRERARWAPGLAVFADVAVKHAAPVAQRPLVEEVAECLERGGADAVILTGPGTGQPTDLADLERVRHAHPGARILVGSGVTGESVAGILSHADAVIVGTSLKRGGIVTEPVDVARARALVDRARLAPERR